MTYSELKNEMSKFNEKYGIKHAAMEVKNDAGVKVMMIGEIIIKPEVFKQELPVEERTYQFSNYNKALTAYDGGYSIFASCPKDHDLMRVEYYENAQIESARIVEVIE